MKQTNRAVFVLTIRELKVLEQKNVFADEMSWRALEIGFNTVDSKKHHGPRITMHF